MQAALDSGATDLVGLAWYEQQIHRMARGRAPKKDLSAWRTVWMQLTSMGLSSFKRRRA